jgi:peptidoglycan/LPS O-acetylase OafA/YrhL
MYLLNSLCTHDVRAALQRIGLAYPPVIFVITQGVTVAAGYLSHRYYETRFLALKERFSRLRHAPPRKKPSGNRVPRPLGADTSVIPS